MKDKISLAGDLGSGKSTVANHLINNINYRIESAGLIFRRLAEEHGMTAKEFNQFIESNPKYDNMVDDTIKEMGEKEECFTMILHMSRKVGVKEQRVVVMGDSDWCTNGEMGTFRQKVNSEPPITIRYNLINNYIFINKYNFF